MGDINHDGDPDLVAAGDGGVELWANDGAGSWTRKTSPTGSEPYHDVAVSDFNHDGDLDIVAAGTSGITFWTGNGAWSWTQGAVPISGKATFTLEVGDTNLDGHPDIVAGGPAGIQVVASNGSGEWAEVVEPTGTDTYHDLVICDIDIDGKPDIVGVGNDSAAKNGTVKVFLGDGDVGWSSPTSVTSGIDGPFHAVGAADVNRDGKPDLVALRAGRIHLWLGDGDGGWSLGDAPSSDGAHRALLVEDFNHDARVDIVAGDENGTKVWLGEAGPGWSAVPATPIHDSAILDLAGADLNGDGRPDIVAATDGDGIKVWISDVPDVVIQGWTEASSGLMDGGKWADVDFGDVDSDGDLDLLVTSYQNQDEGIKVYLGNGAGSWTESSSGLPTTDSWSGAKFWDFNHDGKLDIVAAAEEMTSGVGTKVWRGNGRGVWSYHNTIDTRSGSGMDLGDFNNDGNTDIATGYWSGNYGPMVFLGNRNLTFQPDSGPASTINVADTTIGDVDNDGRQDFAASAINELGILVWTGDGTGGASSWTRADDGLPSSNVYLGLDLGDLDNDGDADIAAGGFGPGSGLHAFLGDGGAGGKMDWSESSSGLPTTGDYGGVELADINLDGNLDLLSGSISNGGIDLLTGDGGTGGAMRWTSIKKSPLPSTRNVWGVKFGDINRDGVLDIAATPERMGVGVWTTDVAEVVQIDRVEITPDLERIILNETVSLTAQAFDEMDRPLAGISYVWHLPEGVIASDGIGGATVHLTGIAEGSGTLMVTAMKGLVARTASLAVTVITPRIPDPPANLEATPDDSVVQLSWDPPLDDGGRAITGYRVYRATAPGVGDFLVDVAVPPFDDTSVVNAVTYYYSVSAVNAIGEGPPTPEVEATPVRRATVPEAPQDLEAEPGDGHVDLTWSAPLDDGGSPITGYLVMMGTQPNAGDILDTLGLVTSFRAEGVVNGVTYYFSVAAINDLGAGSLTLEIHVIPWGLPSPPRNLTAEITKESTVRCEWDPPVSDGGFDLLGYRVFRADADSSDDFTVLDQVSNTSFLDLSVEEGRKYVYKVTALTEKGEGPPTQTVNVEVPIQVGPPPPDEEDDNLIIILAVSAIVGVVLVAVLGLALRSRRGSE
jgi:hypothetical protein